MASNTTEDVGISVGDAVPTTAVAVTATVDVPATSEDRFDPFLSAYEPVVEELSLQQSMDVNKECKFSVLLL